MEAEGIVIKTSNNLIIFWKFSRGWKNIGLSGKSNEKAYDQVIVIIK